MSGYCSAHKHNEPGCRQCEIDNEPMYVSAFRCPECGETFDELYYMESTIMNCPYCEDVLMEKVDGSEK